MQTQYAISAFSRQAHYSAMAVPSFVSACDFMPMRYPLKIKEVRKHRKLTQGELGERIGADQSTIQRWEAGKRQPDLIDINNLASALDVTPADLFGMPGEVRLGPSLNVIGVVQAGLWREALALPEDEWEVFTGHPEVTAPLERRFGLRVAGDSMNELYPVGTILECVRIDELSEIESGRRVIVERERADGEIEATVKELLIRDDGSKWLLPRSTNPEFRPIRVDQDEDGIVETRVIATVVGSYRPE